MAEKGAVAVDEDSEGDAVLLRHSPTLNAEMAARLKRAAIGQGWVRQLRTRTCQG